MGYTWAQFEGYRRAVRLAAVRGQRAQLVALSLGFGGGEGLKRSLERLDRAERDIEDNAEGRVRA